MPSRIGTAGNQYLAKLKRMLANDGRLTRAEAAVLIHEAETGKLSEVEAHYLAGFIDQHADQFDDDAKKQLVDFIVSGELTRLAVLAPEKGRVRQVKQPAITAASAKVRAVRMQNRVGKLAINGFNYNDPMQGQVGDCYLISSMVVVAKRRPDLLKKAIVDNHDGTFTVTFQSRPVRGLPTVPVSITVDTLIAMRHGVPEYASARNPAELWPLIIEKAYAAWKGSFDLIEAGMAANALEALTGGDPSFFVVSKAMNPQEVFDKLDLSNQEGGCVVALSKPEDTGIDGMVADHAYAVLGTEVRANGEKYVKLRNPWGEHEPGNGQNDGIFWLPIAQFLEAFSTVETMALGPAPVA